MSFRFNRPLALAALTFFAFACASLLAPAARAEGRARLLFEQGRKLAQQGRYAEACPKLVQSFQLEIATGTEFNLADCLEHIGERERARTLFIDVVQKSLDAGQKERAAAAHDRAARLASAPAPETPEAKLEPVPELVIEAPKPEQPVEPQPDARLRQVVAARAKLRDEASALAEATVELRTLRVALARLVRRDADDSRAREAERKLAAVNQELSQAWQLAAHVEALAARSVRWLTVSKQPEIEKRAESSTRDASGLARIALAVPSISVPGAEMVSAAATR